jgi:hypothetical protein
MKSDKLKKFVSLLDGLLKEKTALEARLQEINKALGVSTAPAPASPAVASVAAPAPRKVGRPRKVPGAPVAVKAPKAPKAPKAAKGSRKRAENSASLKDTVIAILKDKKSLGRKELLDAVIGGGYKFTATDPLNSLSTLIYSNRKIFNAKSGIISLA